MINTMVGENVAAFLGSWNVAMPLLHGKDSQIPLALLHQMVLICSVGRRIKQIPQIKGKWRGFAHLKPDIYNTSLSDWPSRCRDVFMYHRLYCPSRCCKVVPDTDAYCPHRSVFWEGIFVPQTLLSLQNHICWQSYCFTYSSASSSCERLPGRQAFLSQQISIYRAF